MEPTDDDRRASPREEAYVAAEITVGDRTRIGVVQDASAIGVKILTHTRIEVGERVSLSVQVDGEERVEVVGEVVRRTDLENSGPWRFRLGVSIDEPSEALARHAAAIHARQSKKRG